jgi:Polyketide cyclase / dehydrase and lipid transport
MTVTERRFRSSPDKVFEALVDADRYPCWLVGAKVVQPDPDWPSPGSSFDHRVGFGPIEVEDRTTVRDLSTDRRLRLLVRARPFLEADVDFEVMPDGDGSLLRMDERPRGIFRLAAPLLAPLVRARNDRSLHRLADLIEPAS